MRGVDKSSRVTACLDRRSRRERGSLLLEESRHTRTNGGGRSIARGCRLRGVQPPAVSEAGEHTSEEGGGAYRRS